jgi:iron complex transport system substrate-binding protein
MNAVHEGVVRHLCPSAFICVSVAFLPTASTAAPITLQDDAGRSITLTEPAKRIVTLAPFLTELTFAAGAGNRVMGVSAYSDYPAQARGLPVVSSAAGLSIETLAALRPDLVMVWRDSFRLEDIGRIEGFGAVVYVASGRRLDDVPRLLRVIGTATALEVSAQVSAFEREVASLRATYSARPRIDAFLEIWHRPLTTISGGHFMNDAIEMCGARNVFKDLSGVAPQVSWEEVYARDPFVVVGTGSAANEAEFRANWSERGTLSAVRAGRLVWAEADTLQRPTTRTPQGIRRLCEALDRVR